MNISAYLSRIHYSGSLIPNLETLRALHMAHLLAVPFENLSIALKQPIVLDEDALFNKIVGQGRGGFCYELNGLFAALLRELGFDVTLLSARVTGGESPVAPEFDHLALRVQLDEPWLVDVGFGDGFRFPLRLNSRDPQPDPLPNRAYRIFEYGPDRVLQQQNEGKDWEEQYRFTLQPRQFHEFAGMCNYHQTSPESTFTRRRICSIATPTGRVTLSDMRLIISRNGERREQLLHTEAEYENALHKYFAMHISI